MSHVGLSFPHYAPSQTGVDSFYEANQGTILVRQCAKFCTKLGIGYLNSLIPISINLARHLLYKKRTTECRRSSWGRTSAAVTVASPTRIVKIGGKMKNAVFAALALGAALVLIPLASAESVGSKASGSYVNTNLKTNPSHDGLGVSVADEGTPAARIDAQSKPVKDDAVEEVSSNDISISSNGFAERREIGAAGSRHFYFADKSSSRGKVGAARGSLNQVASIVTLAETPEPESLFLLGTGLLCMALALFWKSAKRSTQP